MNLDRALKDTSFLKKLDNEKIKTHYARIILLDNDEIPIKEITGKIAAGSLSINGSSAMRRAGSLTLAAEMTENDLQDVDNILSMDKKIKLDVGLINNIEPNYPDIIWFKQGIFVINQYSIQHSVDGVSINMSFQDKMCLLDGSCGGGLPSSITFHEYDQIYGLAESATLNDISEPNTYTVYKVGAKYYLYSPEEGYTETKESLVGTRVSVPQRIFDIIQTLVCNYGGEDIARIFIEDVPLEIKQSVRYIGSKTLFYNQKTSIYTLDEDLAATSESWIPFTYNQDCGYVYTDFTYPGELVSGIGDNICNVLENIKSQLGNYEYFYDVDGNFVFREIKNYLNTMYNPIKTLDEDGYILDSTNYYVDFSGSPQSVYTFDNTTELVSSYSNAPNYANIKNDFHIWGESEDEYVIHYHIAIKEKPKEFSTWKVVAEKDKDGEYTGKIHIDNNSAEAYDYTPTDWRAQLYLQGMEKKNLQQRPDIYEQELLDLFDIIYDMREKKYKTDVVNTSNSLTYWIDFLEPVGELQDISVDVIGPRVYSYQQDKIVRIYNNDIPNVIMVNTGDSEVAKKNLISKCEEIGQTWTNVSPTIADTANRNIAIGTAGYTAIEVARDLLYQYTRAISSISISCVPIYYLDANCRISVADDKAQISDDFIMTSISIPLDGIGNMNMSGSVALQRY